MTMTPDPQAKYSPEHGLGRQGLVYDRLRTEWQAAGRAVPGAIWGAPGQQLRPSPEGQGSATGIVQAPRGHWPYGQP
jgi:hypothetical protein